MGVEQVSRKKKATVKVAVGGNETKETFKLPDINLDESDADLSIDEALAQISLLLARVKDVTVLTDLDDNEIKDVASLMAVADRMDDDMMKKWIHYFLKLRVSKARKGRIELLEIAKASKEAMDKKLSGLNQLLGGGGQRF